MSTYGENARAKRQKAWQRMLKQLDVKQQYANKQQKELEAAQAEEAKLMQKAKEKEFDTRDNRYGMRGAAIGGSIVPGWGHLIGGVLGGAAGVVSQGRESGDWGKAIGGALDPRRISEDAEVLLGTGEGQQIATSQAAMAAKGMARKPAEYKPSEAQIGREEDFAKDAELMLGKDLEGTKELEDPGGPEFKFGDSGERQLQFEETPEEKRQRELNALWAERY